MGFNHILRCLVDQIKMNKHPNSLRSPPRKDKRGVDVISDALPFGRLWYVKVGDAIGYAKFRSRSHRAVIQVHDDAGNVLEAHEHAGDIKEP